MSDRPDHNDKDAQAPAALVEALRALAPQKPTVPPALDEEILQQARLHLQSGASEHCPQSPSADSLSSLRGRRGQGRGGPLEAVIAPLPTPPSQGEGEVGGSVRMRPLQSLPSAERRLVPFPRWLAMAAALVLGVGFVFLLTREKHRETPLVREDIDGNGQVDILDAFALARKLQQGAVSAAVFDVNGDGVIDQRDIDWIAARAVKLHKG